jgi:hypothetical protein
MVFSRFPLEVEGEIEFQDSNFIESFARKGAALLKGTFRGHPFRILAAHLQGEDDPRYTNANDNIRKDQLRQIRTELAYSKDGKPYFGESCVPVFFCGDFGTARQSEADPRAESEKFAYMTGIFGADDDGMNRITLDDNRWRNELANDDTGRTDQLDYILLRANGVNLDCAWTHVVLRSGQWDGTDGRQDLSYRYAICATIRLK